MDGGAPMSSQIARKVVAAFQNKPATPDVAESTALNVLRTGKRKYWNCWQRDYCTKKLPHSYLSARRPYENNVYHIYEKTARQQSRRGYQ